MQPTAQAVGKRETDKPRRGERITLTHKLEPQIPGTNRIFPSLLKKSDHPRTPWSMIRGCKVRPSPLTALVRSWIQYAQNPLAFFRDACNPSGPCNICEHSLSGRVEGEGALQLPGRNRWFDSLRRRCF